MSYTTNFYLTKHSLSGATVQYTPPIQANNMSEAMFMVNVEALIGSPTTASLTAAFQVSPIEY